LDPSEDEQDERYDERTDRVLAGDMIRARLKPREKRGKATHWNQPVCGGDGKEQDAKNPGDERQGAVHRVALRRPATRALTQSDLRDFAVLALGRCRIKLRQR
jgi:hypothetical protein